MGFVFQFFYLRRFKINPSWSAFLVRCYFFFATNCLTFTVSTSPAFAASNNCRSASELPKGTPSVEELTIYQVLYTPKYKIKKVPLISSFSIQKYQFKCYLRQVTVFSKRVHTNAKSDRFIFISPSHTEQEHDQLFSMH